MKFEKGGLAWIRGSAIKDQNGRVVELVRIVVESFGKRFWEITFRGGIITHGGIAYGIGIASEQILVPITPPSNDKDTYTDTPVAETEQSKERIPELV